MTFVGRTLELSSIDRTCTTMPRILSAEIDIPVGTLAQVATAD